jgi:hypothetical protein
MGTAVLTDAGFDKAVRFWRSDLRAAMADLLGYQVLSPDQEKHIELLNRYPRVAAMGGTGTGKSFDQGNAALLFAALDQTKAFFGGPTESQAALLSWLEFRMGYARARDAGRNLGGTLQVSRWQGPRDDWFAQLVALNNRDNAASIKGMSHGPQVVWALDELEGIPEECWNAIDGGTTQDNVHLWVSFNPIDPNGADGRFWNATPPEARVQLSAIACAEWQARTGIKIPGMPTLEAIETKWHGRENEPLFYTCVLGQFPPESASWVVVPKDWFDKCLIADPVGVKSVGIGVDTAGGRAENVIAVVENGRVRIAWANRELHQTPRLVTEVKRIAEPYGCSVPIAVDILGQGGKGVADQLRADGYNALDFVGGGREFAGVASSDPSMDLYADRITWAWFQLREAAQATAEGRAVSIRFPDDPLLRDQLARKYAATGERRYKLESKDSANSPDRGDAVAMAWAAAVVGQSYTPRWG